MSLDTWKREFYPQDAASVAKRGPIADAIRHSLIHWRGCLKKNLRKHGVFIIERELADSGSGEIFPLDTDTCALCHRFYFYDGNQIFLSTLDDCGYHVAWRVLDAQFFGIPQRRRRVFVVGHLGDWRRAAAVLLEREGLCRDTPARRKARQTTSGGAVYGAEVGPAGGRFTDLAPTLDARCKDSAIRNQVGLLVFGGNNTYGLIDVATACNAHGGSGRMDFETETFVTHTLRGDSFDAGEDGTGRGTPLVAGTLKANHGGGGFGSDPSETFIPMAFSAKDHGADAGAAAPTLRAMPHDRSHANAGGQIAVCIQEGQTGVREYETVGTVRSDAPGSQAGGSLILHRMAVRRLTPRECERLQGFPDDYTLVPYRGKPAADGPRYRAIGNSMAVPVMRWIGQRIVEA